MQDPQFVKRVSPAPGHVSLWESLRCCLNPRVLIGLGAVAVGIALIRPGLLVPVGPLLLYLICPLSMGLMMWMMMRGMGNLGNQNAPTSIPNAEVRALQARIAQLEAARPVLAPAQNDQMLVHDVPQEIAVERHVGDT